MQTLKDAKVGDQVFVTHPYGARGAQPRIVVKVGRTLLHVTGLPPYNSSIETYRMADGIDSDHYAGAPSVLHTQDELDYEAERRELLDRLKALNIGSARGYSDLNYPNDALKKFLAVAEEIERERKANA